VIKSQNMLTIWRRHTGECPHRDKGRNYLKCNCPIWADGYLNGKRTLRQSLKTRDMARARKRAAELEDPQLQRRALKEAIAAFDAHCVSDGLKPSTLRSSALCRFPDYAARIKTKPAQGPGYTGLLARRPFNMRHSPEAWDQSCLRKASNSSSG
jgi:hypothetical protein